MSRWAGMGVLALCACGQTVVDPCANADFATDAKNCGACGHDCLGATCTAGVCNQETLFTNASAQPLGIALDDDNAYFTTEGEGSLYRCTKATCNATMVAMATGLVQPGPLATDGKNVYFVTASAIMSCPTSGCSSTGPSVFAGNQPSPGQVAIGGGRVWWTTHAGAATDRVLDCSIANGCGSAPEIFADAQVGAEGIAVDATNVSWTIGVTPGGSVLTCPMSGCGAGPTVLSDKVDIPQAIASDGTTAFWTNYTGESLMSCALGGCGDAPAVLASAPGEYVGIAIDATDVYFTGGDAVGSALLRCKKTGCGGAPTVVASGQHRPGYVAVDSTAVYWTRPDDGMVLRLVK